MKVLKYILASVILVDAGQLMIKYGLNNSVFEFGNILASYIGILLNPFVLFGFMAAGLSSIFWITALSKADLSYAYPMISLGYVVVAFLSMFLFSEHIAWTRWLGIFVICSGVFLMSKKGGGK